nr:uncharacterized mitochondrial protein AtMg00810-like [Tanacetum cinerariifolium]
EVLLKLNLPGHRIRRWRYNLTPAESKFKTPMLDHQDKYMMKAQDSGFELTGFSDADYAGCKDSFKSTSGGAQFLGEKLVSWSSTKQDCMALSTAEAEYVFLSVCCAQVLWMQTQLTDYGFIFKKIPIYCDSKSAIAISCNPVQHSRTKHIAVRGAFWYIWKLNVSQMISQDTLIDFIKQFYGSAWQYIKDRPTVVSQGDIRQLRVILFSIHSDEWKSFQSQHQIAMRIKRWHYNLKLAESKFKTPMLNHQDKYMMKAQENDVEAWRRHGPSAQDELKEAQLVLRQLKVKACGESDENKAFPLTHERRRCSNSSSNVLVD